MVGDVLVVLFFGRTVLRILWYILLWVLVCCLELLYEGVSFRLLDAFCEFVAVAVVVLCIGGGRAVC